MLRQTSLSRKITLTLLGTSLVAVVALWFYVHTLADARVRRDAAQKAEEMLSRSAQMFVVSTVRFHEALGTAKDEEDRAKILTDWKRTITAVDEAVIHDFGKELPRVRLIGDEAITGVPPFGVQSTKIEQPFEERALRRLVAGESRHEEVDAAMLRVAVPLNANMHAGCAVCHGYQAGDNKVLGSLNAYVPLTVLMAAADRQAWLIVGSVAGLLLLITVVLWGFITREVTRPVRNIAQALTEGATQTVSASSQVSAASQSLAEGASHQAASLEEASASLEEMSSMTQRNSENAGKASELASQARLAAENGAQDMTHMNRAMAEIKASSDDIAKIIKTIDEIAFQTNILALNAAVEAARAGEAGMGFAVVADEVRNLAQRSAQSAKETADKIEGAISKTGQGVGLSQKVAASLQEIVDKARKVDELAREVAAASKEQSQGIRQVNTAVSEMDKVTQSNAASAEESASAAEELNAQARTLKDAVGDLLGLVEGGQRATVASPVSARELTVPVPSRRPDPILPTPTARPTPPSPRGAVTAGNGRHSRLRSAAAPEKPEPLDFR